MGDAGWRPSEVHIYKNDGEDMKQLDRDESIRRGRIHDLDHVVSFAILLQRSSAMVKRAIVQLHHRVTERAMDTGARTNERLLPA